MPRQAKQKLLPLEGQDLKSLEDSGFFAAPIAATPVSNYRFDMNSPRHPSSPGTPLSVSTDEASYRSARSSYQPSKPEVLDVVPRSEYSNPSSPSFPPPNLQNFPLPAPPREMPPAPTSLRKRKSSKLHINVLPNNGEGGPVSPTRSSKGTQYNPNSPFAPSTRTIPQSPLSTFAPRSVSEIQEPEPKLETLNASTYRPRGLTSSSIPSIPESPVHPPLPPSSNADSSARPSMAPSLASSYRQERSALSREPSMSFTMEHPPLPWIGPEEARGSVKSFRSAWTNASAMTYDSSVPPDPAEMETVTTRTSASSDYEMIPPMPEIVDKDRKSLSVDDVMDMYYDFSDDDDSIYKYSVEHFTDSGTTLQDDESHEINTQYVSYDDMEDFPLGPRKHSPTDSLLTKELPKPPSPMQMLDESIDPLDTRPISPMSSALATPTTELQPASPTLIHSPLRQHPVDKELPSPLIQEFNLPAPLIEPRDRYGFKKATREITAAQYDAWNEEYTDYLDRRRQKWDAIMAQYSLETENPQRFPPKSDKVKRYVRKGIPPEWRGAAWFWYAGGPEQLKKQPGLYQSLVEQTHDGLTETDKDMIERDLHRTFPDSVKFKPDPVDKPAHSGALPGRDVRPQRPDSQEETHIIGALRRVLQAFALHNPSIGYCQSLNFLAGMLLLMLDEDEEKAFILLEVLTTVHFPGIHAKVLEANVDIGVLMSFIQETMPAIWTKINDLDEPTARGRRRSAHLATKLPTATLALPPWFMSLFLNTLPTESALRVWDILFYEGAKTIFRIALALFKLGEQDIRAINDPLEILQVVQALPRRMLDVNLLIETTFKRRGGFAGISQETVEQRRAQRRILARQEQQGEPGQKKTRERGMTVTLSRANTAKSSATSSPASGAFPEPPPVPESSVAAFMASRPSMDQRRPSTRDGSTFGDKEATTTTRGRVASMVKKGIRATSRSRKRKDKKEWDAGWNGMEAN